MNKMGNNATQSKHQSMQKQSSEVEKKSNLQKKGHHESPKSKRKPKKGKAVLFELNRGPDGNWNTKCAEKQKTNTHSKSPKSTKKLKKGKSLLELHRSPDGTWNQNQNDENKQTHQNFIKSVTTPQHDYRHVTQNLVASESSHRKRNWHSNYSERIVEEVNYLNGSESELPWTDIKYNTRTDLSDINQLIFRLEDIVYTENLKKRNNAQYGKWRQYRIRDELNNARRGLVMDLRALKFDIDARSKQLNASQQDMLCDIKSRIRAQMTMNNSRQMIYRNHDECSFEMFKSKFDNSRQRRYV